MNDNYKRCDQCAKAAAVDFYEDFWARWMPRDPIEALMHARKKILLHQFLSAYKRERALFVGCGSGNELPSFYAATALDVSSAALRRSLFVKHNVEHKLVQGDGCELPFKDNAFNCVVCAMVFEHIAHRAKMLAEFDRVLSDDGILLLEVPNVLSLFGLAKKAYELVFRRKYITEDQPVDDWFTLGSLTRVVAEYFRLAEARGFWYFPPMGCGSFRLPSRLVLLVFERAMRLDTWLGRCVPSLGSSLITVWSKTPMPRAGNG